MNQTVKHYFYNTFYQLLMLAVPLVTTPYLSRVLGAGGMGTYAFHLTAVTYFTMFIILGLETYGCREIARNKDNGENLNKTFSSIYYLQLICGLIVLLAYGIYCIIITDQRILSIVFTINILAYCLDVSWFLYGVGGFKQIAFRSLIIKAITTVCIFLIIKSEEDLLWYCLIMVCGNLGNQLLVWPFVIKKVKFRKVSAKDIFRHIKPNLLLFLTIISVTLFKTVDKLMLGIFEPSKVQLGYYELSERIISIPNLLIASAGTVMLPKTSKQVASCDDSYKKTIQFSIIIVTLIAASLSFGIMGVAKEFVPLFYGDGYEPCVLLYYILLPCSLFMAVGNVIRTQYLLPNKKDLQFAVSGLLSLAVNVILNAILIKPFGAVGAAIGTLAAEIAVCSIQLFFVRKKLPIYKYVCYALIISLIGASMFGLLFSIDFTQLGQSLLISLIIKIIIGAAYFIAVILLIAIIGIKCNNKTITDFVNVLLSVLSLKTKKIKLAGVQKMINFNNPPFVGSEIKYIKKAIASKKICGDGQYNKLCSQWMEKRFNVKKVLLTTSGTTALDMAMLLCDIKPGDEVILPSYTFSSTATSAVLAGAKLVFVDIRPDTMNIDENKIESAITDKTKVIMVMHYAGVACEMDTIMQIAKKHNLKVVEDAAQAVMSTYKGKPLGTIGDFGCFSFHETKNYSMGEGGAILINREEYIEKAEILREKGTNRSKFFRGQVDKYTWVDFGDSYLPSELNAAYLWGELQVADKIFEDRINSWNFYYEKLKPLEQKNLVNLPVIPDNCGHNAHMFYIKCKDLEERTKFIDYMKQNGIMCTFHYVPLHSAPAGLKYGRFYGEDEYTTSESDKLVRLPMYYGLSMKDKKKIVGCVNDFFSNGNLNV